MTDKKDFNAEVYKNNVKNIKLSEKQKAELIKVMRDTEKQYKQNNVSHKMPMPRLTKSATGSLNGWRSSLTPLRNA